MILHYPHRLDPKEYPDYTRRPFAVPTWDTFSRTTQFTVLRGFTEKEGRLVDWREKLDLYCERFKLGKVIWPFFSTIRAENFADLVREIKRRGYYLFDIWGYVPGSDMDGAWRQ